MDPSPGETSTTETSPLSTLKENTEEQKGSHNMVGGRLPSEKVQVWPRTVTLCLQGPRTLCAHLKVTP